MYPFKCENDSENRKKSISKPQSKKIEFEENKNCLDGKKYQQECNISFNRSLNHEMYLQLVKKLHYLNSMTNDVIRKKIESSPWN